MESDIDRNIKDRQEAEELFELIFDGDRRQRFWETIRDLAVAKLPQPKERVDSVPAMSDLASITFECQLMPFGKHQGREIGCVPVDYLIWLSEGGDDFRRQLQMYFKSERGKQRIRDEQE